MPKTLVEYALMFSEYFPVYSLAKGTTVPLKGSHGHLDATQDQEKIVDWFTEKAPEGNLAASFIGTPYVVLDIDRKGDKDGVQSLNAIKPKGADMGDPVVVQTKNNGFHLYYRTDADIQHKVGWLESVDVLKNSCVLPPTKALNEQGEPSEYKLVKGSLENVSELPQWLLNAILRDQQRQERQDSSIILNFQNDTPTKKYTALFLEEIVDGVGEGNRNEWLTKQVGKLLYLGMNATAAYEFTRVINENFISPKLKDGEVNAVFKSILKRESTKV